MRNLIRTICGFVLVLASCTDSVPMPENNSGPTKEIRDKYSTIVEMANEAISETCQKGRSGEAVEVLDVTPWLASEIYTDVMSESRGNKISSLPDTLLYIVNYKNDLGFALVSDNEKFKGVVAIIPEQNFYKYDDWSENPGFSTYLGLYKDALVNDVLNKSFSLNDFKKYFSFNNDSTKTRLPNDVWETKTVYENKLIQEWGQSSPYNKYCFTVDGKQAKAGCVPVAVSQVLTYFDYPSSINGYKISWANTHCVTPSTQTQVETVSRLIHEVGILCNATYDEGSTRVSGKDLRTALIDLGYKFSESKFTNEIQMIHNLYEYAPALIGANAYKPDNSITGHLWVIDGAKAQVSTVDGEYKVRFLYHCNWGWYGRYNGYYLCNAFNPYGDREDDTYEFNYDIAVFFYLEKSN